MHMKQRSRVIGRMPKPETRGTERQQAGREVFGEAISTTCSIALSPCGSRASGVTSAVRTPGKLSRTSLSSFPSCTNGPGPTRLRPIMLMTSLAALTSRVGQRDKEVVHDQRR
jgi:hypothetical protein